jgi:hypothetical protein
MAVFDGETFRNERIVLDDNSYKDCILVDCEIVYGGGEVHLNFTTQGTSRWTFEGCALNTIRLLQALTLLPQDPTQLLALPNAGIVDKERN